MRQPYRGKNPAGDPYVFPCHQEESDAHQERDAGDDRHLRGHLHPFLFHKALQVVFIQLRALEPGVQPLGAAGKAIGRHQQEGGRGKDGFLTF